MSYSIHMSVVEIRKHYPADPAKPDGRTEFDYVPEKSKNNITEGVGEPVVITQDALKESSNIVAQFVKIIIPILESKRQVSYNYIVAEIEVIVKMAAMRICEYNQSMAGRLIGLKRTTFAASLVGRGLLISKSKKVTAPMLKKKPRKKTSPKPDYK